jgi:hypothetical protein
MDSSEFRATRIKSCQALALFIPACLSQNTPSIVTVKIERNILPRNIPTVTTPNHMFMGLLRGQLKLRRRCEQESQPFAIRRNMVDHTASF